MDNGRYSLIDMLDHQPDLLSDSKIKAMMTDIYNNIIGYIDNGNSDQVSSLISSGGVRNFIQWFIENVYSPNTSDVKVISYVNDNLNDILDILSQAISNLTPKEVIENMKEEKVDGAEEVAEENDSQEAAISEIKNELEDETRNDDQQLNPVPQTKDQETENETLIPPKVDNETSDEEASNTENELSERDKAFSFIDSFSVKR